jgi:PAS domain S-box-containing protein
MHARILDANGRYQRFLLSVSTNGADNDARGGFAAAAIKLADSEVSEPACCAEEGDLRFPWGHLPLMVWSAQADGYVDFVNDRWVRFTGLSLEQAKGWGWKDAVHPDDRDRCVRVWLHLLENGLEGSCECRLGSEARGYRWCVSVVNPLRDAKGSIVRWYGAILDITEAKEAERRLQQAHDDLAHATRVATLGELTASIAHEVSQPLAAIAANGAAGLRWLARAQPDVGEGRLAVERMIRDAQRASGVVRQLRALARKDATARTLDDVNRIIRETVLLAQPLLSRNRVVLKLDLCADLPRVEVHAVQLQQVLINLMTNGSQSMDGVLAAAKVLTVSSSASADGGVRVVVRDVGTGIAATNQDKLFSPFFTTRRDGMGMGLSICKTIIENHGGTISACNNHTGPGAQLIVELPRPCRSATHAIREKTGDAREAPACGGGTR